MLPRLGNGWRSAFVRRCSGADVQKCLCGDDGIEKTVSFDAAFKVPEVYEHGADGHVGSNISNREIARAGTTAYILLILKIDINRIWIVGSSYSIAYNAN